jgi:hypothetical protein
MAQYVKVATIGARPALPVGKAVGQDAVDHVIAYWKRELDQVLPDRPDLIVLPECCDRLEGPSTAELQEYYRFRGDKLLDFFADVAMRRRCYIAYPRYRLLSDGTWRNSVHMIDRRGSLAGTYNKNYVVVTETTEWGVLCGKDAPLIECDFGRVACAICFDLNFDELRLRYQKARPDLILFCSVYHGGLMQSVWAYSCRSHFVSSVAGLPSGLMTPLGQVVATSTNYFNFAVGTLNLDCCVAHLDFNWEKLTALKLKYGAGVKIFDPGLLAPVLISSETRERTAREMVEEFEIEQLDDYMERSMAHRHNPANREA